MTDHTDPPIQRPRAINFNIYEAIEKDRAELDAKTLEVHKMLCELNATNEQIDLVFSSIFLANGLGGFEGIAATLGLEPTQATSGRRSIGAASRAKVAKAAEKLRHLSKEKAAVILKDSVHLDSGTIRRYLSELFPGNTWKKR